MTPYRFLATRFCEQVVQYNNLAAKGFAQWAFYPGMLFQSRERWWDNGGFRDKPHEGIDLCLYNDQSGSTRALDTAAPIPVMYRGCVKNIIDDYIGKTIFMAHDIYNDTVKQLYSIYGHVEPLGRIERGVLLEEGEVVASIAGTEDKRFKILPHVHISVAWISRNFPPEQLNWQSMNESPDIILLNPLDIFNSNYTILQQT
jgi:hypothetical protein